MGASILASRSRGPASAALDVVDHAQAPYPPHHFLEVARIRHFDGEADHRDVAVALQVFHPVDVGVGIGDGSCQQTCAAKAIVR